MLGLFAKVAAGRKPCAGQFGGKSVSQSPLKDQPFSTFLDQNPPLELRPENGISPVSMAIEQYRRRYKGSAFCGGQIVERRAIFAFLGCSQHHFTSACLQ